MKTKISILSVAFGVLFLASCGSESTSNKTEEVIEVVPKTEVKLSEEFVLPSTVQIGDLFRNSGLQYVDGLTLDPKLVSNYNTTFDKYLVFGTYWADMTYCVLNQKSQEARTYMSVIKGLSSELGMDDVYGDKVIMERFENNLDNEDSILIVLIDIDEKSDQYIEDNDQAEFALVAFVSGWVEGMYLGVSTSDVQTHTKVTGRIIEQMVILKNLNDGLAQYKGVNAKMDKIIDEMSSLHSFYMNIPAIKNVEGSIKDVKIPTTDMKLLGDKIIDLRTLITE